VNFTEHHCYFRRNI